MSTPRTIAGLTVGSSVLATVGSAVETGTVDGRIVVGGALATIGLLAISDFAPSLALGLAVVIAITSALTAGPTVISKLDPTR